MKKISGDRVFIKFSKPDLITNAIVVSRVLPDNTAEPIGKIYSDIDDKTGSVMYISTNNQGEEIFSPTVDFIDIENNFERYAKELSEKSLTEEMEVQADEFKKRDEALKGLRRWKLRLETKLINR